MEFLLYELNIAIILVALYVIFFRKKRKKSTSNNSVFNNYSSSSYTANSGHSNYQSKQDPYPYVDSFDENISSNASDILLPDVDTDANPPFSYEDNEVKFGGGMTGGGGAGGDWSSSDSGSDFDITD